MLALFSSASTAQPLETALPIPGGPLPAVHAVALGVALVMVLAVALCSAMVIRKRSQDAQLRDDLLARLQEDNAALCCELAELRSREELARVNAERFRSLTSLSSDWYWEQDQELRFTMCTTWLINEKAIPHASLIGRRRWELEGLVGDPGWEEHRQLLAARRPFRGFEYQIRIAEELRWVSVNGEPVFDDLARFKGYRGTTRDISRRKRVELALRASEERFNEMIGSMPVAVFIKDPESRVLLMNRECERQWGITLDQIQGTTGSRFFGRQEMEQYLAMDRDAFARGVLLESEGFARNVLTGEILTVKTFKKPVFDGDGTPRYLIGISVDITQSKHAERQLRESRELLRELARHQARVKEEERKRIARDIHDELGQNLLALKLEVGSIVKGVMEASDARHDRANLIMETVDRTIRSVRHIINDLRPAVLDLGLVPALEWQAREFNRRTGLPCGVDIGDTDRDLALDDMHATTLFRVLQESLTNVQRHAGASEVCITLHCANGIACLSVIDNGKGGVSLDTGRQKQSFGLLGMRERLRLLGGGLDVSERPGGGTILVASVPLAVTRPS